MGAEDVAGAGAVVLEGEVEVLKSGRRIALLEEVGAFIGEMGPLRKKPRSATVVATRREVRGSEIRSRTADSCHSQNRAAINRR